MTRFLLFLLLFYSCSILLPVLCTSCRLQEQISVTLPKSKIHCFRLLNGTHQTGCQSDKHGNTGTVVKITGIHELEYVIDKFAGTEEDVIILIDVVDLTAPMIRVLFHDKIIRGILLYGEIKINQHSSSELSEDGVCPQEQFSIYEKDNTCFWNHAMHPQGIRYLDWNKPIFFIDDPDEVKILLDTCFLKYNKGLITHYDENRERCRAKMSLFQHAAGTADMCMRRQNLFYGLTDTLTLCEPLSNYNVFSLIPTTGHKNPVNLLVLSAQLDSASAFSESQGGDVTVLTSVITLLAVANALGQNYQLFTERAASTNRQILFSFFNGEAMGYIGSSRVAFDMMMDQFPAKYKSFGDGKTGPQIHLEDIACFLELQHIGWNAPGNDRNYVFHVDQEVYNAHEDIILSIMANTTRSLVSRNFQLRRSNERGSSRVPPSSYQSFLRHNRSIPGLVLSPDPRGRYEYGALFSIFDTAITDFPKVRETARQHIIAVANSIVDASTGFAHNDVASASDFPVNETYIDVLVECFFARKWDCEHFKLFVPNFNANYHAKRYLYVGTETDGSALWYIVHALLVQALGETHATSNVNGGDQCETLNPGQTIYHYNWAYYEPKDRDICFRTTTFTTKAQSPAFGDDGFNPAYMNYSTWVESMWDVHKLELFLATRKFPTIHVVAALCLLGLTLIISLIDWKLKHDDYFRPPNRVSSRGTSAQASVYFQSTTPSATIKLEPSDAANLLPSST